jgi:hypothetical protein
MSWDFVPGVVRLSRETALDRVPEVEYAHSGIVMQASEMPRFDMIPPNRDGH